MINAKRFFGYLATGVMPEMTALDAALSDHDRRFHGGHYDGTQFCSLRGRMHHADNVDDVTIQHHQKGRTITSQGNVSEEEIKSFAERLADWMTVDNFEKAKGKTREQIFKEFGNELEPIAYIPSGYTEILDKEITDNRVYSGKGYMLDHAVNHHPEVEPSEYLRIQAIIDTADDVKLDERNPNRNKSLLFVKNIGDSGVVIVSFDKGENGKIILHKSFFTKMKAGRFDKLPSVKLSSEVGNPSISHTEDSVPAVRLSALEDNNIKPNF